MDPELYFMQIPASKQIGSDLWKETIVFLQYEEYCVCICLYHQEFLLCCSVDKNGYIYSWQMKEERQDEK